MLRPSYSDLLQEINKGKDEGDVIGSRYTIVIAAAKRARQLVDHAEPLIDVKVAKPVSIAVNELYEGKIKIVQREEIISTVAKNIVETNFEEEFLED